MFLPTSRSEQQIISQIIPRAGQKSMWHAMWLQWVGCTHLSFRCNEARQARSTFLQCLKDLDYSELVIQTTCLVSWSHRSLCWLGARVRVRVRDIFPFYHAPILSRSFQIVWDTQHYFNKFPFCLNQPESESATVITPCGYIQYKNNPIVFHYTHWEAINMKF